MDAIIALGLVIGVFTVIVNFEFFTPEETSKTIFLNLHYISEDSLDVLNKKEILDNVGYGWSLNTNESLDDAKNISKKYLNLIIPGNVGYALAVEGKTIYNSDTEINGTRPRMEDASVVTHSSRLLVGYEPGKPAYGDVARSYIVIRGLNFSEEIWNETICAVADTCHCCATPGCVVPSGAGCPNSYNGEDVYCYSENCTIAAPNQIMHNSHAYCCGIIPERGIRGKCTTNAGNQVMDHVDVMCCGEQCAVTAGNNIKSDSNIFCMGNKCNVNISSGNQIMDRINITSCGNNSKVYVNVGQHLMGGPNNVYCKGDNCTVDVDAGSKKIEDTSIYCYGDGCSAKGRGKFSKNNPTKVYCCGKGCSANCSDDAGCTRYINDSSLCPPKTSLCESTWCDEYCNTSTDNELLLIPTHYTPPALKASGSGNITVYYDINGDNVPDGNFTVDVVPGSKDPFDPCYNLTKCTTGNILDSADFAFASLLDKINTRNDNNTPGDIFPLKYGNGTLNPWGDGGRRNPVDINSSNIKLYIVHGSNIQSLWGPAKFKLIVWM